MPRHRLAHAKNLADFPLAYSNGSASDANRLAGIGDALINVALKPVPNPKCIFFGNEGSSKFDTTYIIFVFASSVDQHGFIPFLVVMHGINRIRIHFQNLFIVNKILVEN